MRRKKELSLLFIQPQVITVCPPRLFTTARGVHCTGRPARVGTGGRGLQLVQRSQHTLLANLVLLRLDRYREVGIEAQDVILRVQRHRIEVSALTLWPAIWRTYRQSASIPLGQHTAVSPGQISVSVLQLCILVTVPQLTLHAGVATLVLLVLLHP
jgi:hypothetical protein